MPRVPRAESAASARSSYGAGRRVERNEKWNRYVRVLQCALPGSGVPARPPPPRRGGRVRRRGGLEIEAEKDVGLCTRLEHNREHEQ